MKGFVLGFILAFVFLAADGRAKGEFKQVPRWWIPQALCVHHYEGSWRDPHPPYYGGMQLDLNFQRRYGGWLLVRLGTADHWSSRAQLIVAYRGWKQRSWSPWPRTAARCGLL